MIMTMINLEEWEPETNDKKWEKIKGSTYFFMTDIPKIEYIITDALIKYVSKNKKKFMDHKNENSDIIRIFEIVSDDKRFIGYTRNNIGLMLGKMLANRAIGNKTTFDTEFSNEIIGLRITLLECVLKTDTKPVNKSILTARKEVYQLGKIEKNNFYEIIMPILNDIYKTQKTTKGNECNIYEITNLLNKKTYMTYLSDKDIENHEKILIERFKNMNNETVKINEKQIQIKILDKFQSKSVLECELKTDFYISKDKKNSYTGYNIADKFLDKENNVIDRSQIKRIVFLILQKESFDKNFIDPIESYTDINGYIYEIVNKNEDKKFIASSIDKTLKQIIGQKYKKAIEKPNSKNKLFNLLGKVPFSELKINVIKKKGKKDRWNLDVQLKKYIKQYNTIENGYNKDIENKNRMAVAYKIAKK
jgi:hypothetical protein